MSEYAQLTTRFKCGYAGAEDVIVTSPLKKTDTKGTKRARYSDAEYAAECRKQDAADKREDMDMNQEEIDKAEAKEENRQRQAQSGTGIQAVQSFMGVMTAQMVESRRVMTQQNTDVMAMMKQGTDALVAVAASIGTAAAAAVGQEQGSNDVMGSFRSMLLQHQQQQHQYQQQLEQQQKQFQLTMEQQQREQQWREGHPPRRQ